MALWAYALATVSTTKSVLGIKDDKDDAKLEECVNEASSLIESAWGRALVSRGSLTEYQTYECPIDKAQVGVLHLIDWPIVSVTSVHEDSARVYATPLVVDTDYIISKPAGKLIRVNSALPIDWATGWRAIKVVYTAGYQNVAGSITGAAAVPPEIMRVFYELVGWMFHQRTSGQVGLTQVQDGFGNRTFSGPAYVTPAMLSALNSAGATWASLSVRTGERDA